MVAVSGPSGAGKTTLVHNVAALLGDATVFIMEHYQAAENEKKQASGDFVLHDPAAWKEAGYDLNLMAPPPRSGVEDLQRLVRGEAVRPSGAKRPVEPARFVLFEDAGARDLELLDPLIDFSVHIDIPLDVSLCRVLLRFERNGGSPMQWVRNYLDYSLHHFYARLQRVGERADRVLDGARPADELAREVADEIRERFT